MALFKINRGANTQRLINPNYSENGENKYIQPKDGYCYFDTSTGLFFIDAENENGEVIRAPINAAAANKLAAARTISLTGSVTGSGSFDGSGNLSIATTTNHTHKYAGSSSAGGSATSAVKLTTSAGSTTQPIYFSDGKPVAITGAIANSTTGNAATATKLTTSAGSATQPVYFNDGKPVACTYSLNKTVPSNAVFTDTVYTHPSYTSKASGLYKITVDNIGHVAGTAAVTGHDIENILGYTPSDNEHTHLYAGSESVGGPANSVKESLSFAVGGVEKGSYNGSVGHKIEINAIDLNISSALRYIGRTNNKPVNETITLVSGSQVTAEPGNVVIWTDGNIEYLFDDDRTWIKLGEASSFSLAPHIHGNISNQGYITNEEGISLPNRILTSDGTGYIEGGIAFSSSITSKFLNENGTWQAVNAPTKTGTGASGTWGISITGNAATATKLGTSTVGSSAKPIYLNDGSPTACIDFLPLSAGENKKLTGPLGLTENVNYGTSLPAGGFNGQLFFLEEESGSSLPTGGTMGQVLVKNSSVDGDAGWSTDISGNAATATKAIQDGNGNVISSTYLPLSGGTLTGYLSLGNNSNASIVPAAGIRIPDLRDCTPGPGMFGDRVFNIYFDQAATGDWQSIMHIKGWTNDYVAYELAGPAGKNNYNQGLYYRAGVSGSWQCEWKKLWMSGDAVTGAVWNDYAEYRESNCEEFGYVLMETGDDSLTKTTERLSHFAGISSDTWGFSQGKTARARTPIAVAGRVLVYPYQDRNNYKPGDCVCAAPGGTVDIMTREEVREWPDRIVGIVSCVPNYEEWGGGKDADRDPVKVNGRIWIKVK